MGQPVELSPDFDNKFIALKYFSAMGAIEFSYRVEQSPRGLRGLQARYLRAFFSSRNRARNTRSLDLSSPLRGSERRSG